MLETLMHPSDSHGAENSAVETISRKDVCAAWLGAAIDGEGCITAYWGRQTNPKYRGDNTLRIRLQVQNTHHLFIRKMTECLIELGVPFIVTIGKARNRCGVNERTLATVVVEGKGRMRKLMPLIIPHLASKRRQAELVLELIEYREALAVDRQESKGRFAGMKLQENETLNGFIREIAREKHVFANVLDFERSPNTVFGESSETTRSARAA